MEFIALLKGIVIGLVASIPLGPIGVMCIQRTLSKSHRSGFISGLGAATADSLFATVALFSLTVVMSFIENYIAIIKALGGISVIIVGMAIFLKNPAVQIRRNRAGKGSLWSDYLSLFFITLANPAFILIFVALFAAWGISYDGIGFTDGMIMILGVLGGASLRQPAAQEIPSASPVVDQPRHGGCDRRARCGGYSLYFYTNTSSRTWSPSPPIKRKSLSRSTDSRRAARVRLPVK